MEIPF